MNNINYNNKPLNTIGCYLNYRLNNNDPNDTFHIIYYHDDFNNYPNQKNLFTTQYFINNINPYNVRKYLSFDVIINNDTDYNNVIKHIDKLNKLIKLNDITLPYYDDLDDWEQIFT